MTDAAVPAPSLTDRRHPPGASSARGLLFTVLGEFVLPYGGEAWTSAVIDLLSRLGVEEKAARQALTRVAASGWLEPERQGRRTRWRLTERGRRLLTEGTERIYGFAGLADRWDGRFLLVLASSPEGDRATRHLVRTRLEWAGLGSPRSGVWVSTHADRLGEVQEALAAAGVLGDSQIFVGTHEGGGELTAMVRQAWDLDAIAAAYDAFIAEFEPGLSTEPAAGDAASDAAAAGGSGATAEGATITDGAAAGAAAGGVPGAPAASDPLARLTELVHAWRRFPRIDPALPRSLLPAGWSGERGAAVFAACHLAWGAPARVEWRSVNRAEA
jgi:phenylacetic acid degradation operon negative regulatory protein